MCARILRFASGAARRVANGWWLRADWDARTACAAGGHLRSHNLLVDSSINSGLLSGSDIYVDKEENCFSGAGSNHIFNTRLQSAFGGSMNTFSATTLSTTIGGHDITMAVSASFLSAAGGSNYVVEHRPTFNSQNVHTLGLLMTRFIGQVQQNNTVIVTENIYGIVLSIGTASDTAVIIFPSGIPNGWAFF